MRITPDQVVVRKGNEAPNSNLNYTTYLTHLDRRCFTVQMFGCTIWEVGLIAMLIPTHDLLLLRLYIGELRGRNISTVFASNLDQLCSYAMTTI